MSARWIAVLVVVAALGAGSASAQLYINGPLSTGPTSNSGVAAPGGTTWSELQNDTGNLAESNTLAGVSCSSTATLFRCADDFTVPVASPGWTVGAVIVYAYQTGFAGGTSPITAGTLRIFDRRPDAAGAVLLCGDTTTNVLASSTDARMFRIFNSAVPPPGSTPGTTRRIWRNELTVPAACAGANFFQAGTYWIDWNTSIGTAAHFAPPVTVAGVRGLPGWNALQDTGTGTYQAVVDVGNPSTAKDLPMDFPFELMGPDLSLDECQDDLLIPTGSVSGSFMAGNSISTAGVVQVVGAGARFRAPSIALGSGFSVASAVPFTAETTRPCFKDPGGVIPDNDPTGLTLTFSVAGLSRRLSRVSARLEMAHSYVGDLTASLISPGGVARLILLGRPGYRPPFAGGPSGVSADLDGVYLFDDFAAGDFWATIAGLGGAATIPSGVYRTSTAASRPAGSVLSNAGGCTTFLSGAFSGLTAAQANGTWTLQLVDAAGGDLGSVNAATLFLEQSDSVSPNPIQGSPVRGVCTPARFDFTGTGRTSYAYVIDDAGSLRWKIKGNDGSPGGQPEQTFVVGSSATDFWVPDDYDGDGIWDAAAWGPDPANPPSGQRFVIRRSSRPTDDLLVLPLGTSGDNPTVYGDYDGDRVADPSVLRVPPGTGSDVLFLSLHSTDGGAAVTQWVPTQTTSDFLRPFPGDDLTGDGIDDLAIARAGTWEVFDGFSGALFDTFSFALATDPVYVPGNFVGSEWGDFTRVFVDGSDVKWQTRDGETGALGAEIIHGAIVAGFAEFAAPGDFDGDGIGDYTVWRRDNTGSNSRFIIRQSSDLSVAEFLFGEPGGAPVPGAQAN